ncbi:hypothetical protein FS842_008676 [Serendipita sp. 407]|nr:hypothetical protein FS842_008676 [Serendipita sp. 407]
MDDLYARFNPNPNKIAAWRRLLMLDQKCSLSPSYMPRHSSPSPVAKPSEKEACSPDVLYNRAIPTLLRYRDELVKGGWRLWPEDQLAQGLLFMVEYTGNDLPLRHTAVDRHSYPLLDSEELFPLESPVVSTPSSSHSSSSLSSFSSGSSSVLHSEDESSHASSAQSILFGLPSDLSGFLEHREAIEDTMRNRRLFKPVLDTKGDIVLSTTFDAIPRELGNRTDDISQTLSRNQPLADIFYLLQLIVPGMFLLVQDSLSIVSKGKPLHICLEPPGTAGSIHWEERTRPMGSNDSFRGSRRSSRRTTKDSSIESRSTARVYLRRTRRALPPADWITSRTETMEKIFGKHLLQDLLNCARDVELTVWRTEHGPPEEDYVGSLGGVGSVECFDME